MKLPAATLPASECALCVICEKRFTRIDRMHKLHSGSEFTFSSKSIQHIWFLFFFIHFICCFISRAQKSICCYSFLFVHIIKTSEGFFLLFSFRVLMFDSFPACWFVDFHKFVRSISSSNYDAAHVFAQATHFFVYFRWKKNWKSPLEKVLTQHP